VQSRYVVMDLCMEMTSGELLVGAPFRGNRGSVCLVKCLESRFWSSAPSGVNLREVRHTGTTTLIMEQPLVDAALGIVKKTKEIFSHLINISYRNFQVRHFFVRQKSSSSFGVEPPSVHWSLCDLRKRRAICIKHKNDKQAPMSVKRA
jgi:hypothetical protein